MLILIFFLYGNIIYFVQGGIKGIFDFPFIPYCFLEVLPLMQDMIKKIVEMDEKARNLTEEVQKSKLDYESNIALAKENIVKDYLKRARERVNINQEYERKAAEEALENTKESHKKISQKLDEQYEQNCDKWVEEIFNRVVSG